MHWTEAEELAVAVLGYCEDDELDSNAIENKIFDKFEISMDQFQKVAEALIPFTPPVQAAISGESFNGFVNDGAFICKQPVTPNVVSPSN